MLLETFDARQAALMLLPENSLEQTLGRVDAALGLSRKEADS
jgi:hypothetical protein